MVPMDANAELTVPGGELRSSRSLPAPADDEITDAAGLVTTTALCTAWDLEWWLLTVKVVVAMDALGRVGRFAPGAVLQIQCCVGCRLLSRSIGCSTAGATSGHGSKRQISSASQPAGCGRLVRAALHRIGRLAHTRDLITTT
jgi:hypothetical protein